MKKLPPPTHFEPEYLYVKYELLRKATYNKFKDKMKNDADRGDLSSAIDSTFIQLVYEYDPNIGVDFPYFIKKMLDLRVYHFVDKYLRSSNKEQYASSEEEEFIIEDESYQEIFERIVDLNSLDPDLELGEKHRNLLIGVLIHGKTLNQLAEEEGVPPDRLHARLYFLIKKFKKAYEEHKEMYGEDMY